MPIPTPTAKGWVRYPMWDRWRDLTRFRLASEMALSSYGTYVSTFPVTSDSALTIYDPSGDSAFKCELRDFESVLRDEQQLYRVIFPSYVALIEDLGRELLETLIRSKGIPASTFKRMPGGDVGEAAHAYVALVAVEVWGEAILKLGSRKWSGFKGGKGLLIEAIVVRNLLAHGEPLFNQKAVKRIEGAVASKSAPKVGDPVRLDKATFNKYVAALRGFGRVLSDAVAGLPDAALPKH